MAISQQRFDRLPWNSIWRRILTILNLATDKNLIFLKNKMTDGRCRDMSEADILKVTQQGTELVTVRMSMRVHIGATWWIRLNGPCAAAMQLYVKLLWPLVLLQSAERRNGCPFTLAVCNHYSGIYTTMKTVPGIPLSFHVIAMQNCNCKCCHLQFSWSVLVIVL